MSNTLTKDNENDASCNFHQSNKLTILFSNEFITSMVNTGKQIAYWIDSASEDIATARILIEKNRSLHGLFFCHLVVEKALKAHVVKKTSELAPRSHNLYYLLESAGLEVTTEEEIFLGVLMNYQLKGRYPDFNPSTPDQSIVKEYLEKTEKLLKWLIEKL